MAILEIIVITSWITDSIVASGMIVYSYKRKKQKAMVTWFVLWVLVSLLYYWIS